MNGTASAETELVQGKDAVADDVAEDLKKVSVGDKEE